jgi:hypothetical protein
MNTTNKILSEISAGELFDKITILQIKMEKIQDPEKQIIINKELSSLNETLAKHIQMNSDLEGLMGQLKNINLQLWDIEEGKREFERQKDFGDTFVQLARRVYQDNDKRAKVKAEINKLTNSNISEVKSYKAY